MPPPAFIPGPIHPRRASANHQFVPLPNWPAAPGPSDIRRANPLGPNISIYGRDAQFIVYSDLLRTLPLKPGYQDAHKIYEEMRDQLARQAYALSVPEVVCVKAYLAVMIPRAKKPTLISVSVALYNSEFNFTNFAESSIGYSRVDQQHPLPHWCQ